MSDGMGRELAYLSSHATNRYFIPNWGNYYFTSKYSPPFLSYNPIFHRWQHLYQALMWAIVVVTIVYNKKKIFFCGKVYIVMYFLYL